MKKFVVLMVLSLAICNIVTAQALPQLKKVNKIKLLKSTRDDVKAIFSSSQSEKASSANHVESFYTDNSMVEVEYSMGDCQPKNTQRWNVPEWRVIRMTVVPGSFVKPSNAKLNLSEFKMKSSSYSFYGDTHPDETYINDEKGIKFVTYAGNILEIEFTPSSKYVDLRCPLIPINTIAKTPPITETPVKTKAPENTNTATSTAVTTNNTLQIFTSRTRRPILENSPANVLNIILSTRELQLNNCSSSEQSPDKACSIEVLTVAKDPESDVLTYNYTISGGKIINASRKTIWDLSGVKAGTYTITAAVDDGCGFCGMTVTKTIVVK